MSVFAGDTNAAEVTKKKSLKVRLMEKEAKRKAEKEARLKAVSIASTTLA